MCLVGGRVNACIEPELDWFSHDYAVDAYPERLHGSARVPIGAGGTAEAGMESEEGTAFELLPRRKSCRNTTDSGFS